MLPCSASFTLRLAHHPMRAATTTTAHFCNVAQDISARLGLHHSRDRSPQICVCPRCHTTVGFTVPRDFMDFFVMFRRVPAVEPGIRLAQRIPALRLSSCLRRKKSLLVIFSIHRFVVLHSGIPARRSGGMTQNCLRHETPHSPFGQSLTVLPLPWASRYHRPHRQCELSDWGLPPHKVMPMLAVHPSIEQTSTSGLRPLAAAPFMSIVMRCRSEAEYDYPPPPCK